MPICKLLRRFDSSAPSTGKVYLAWYEIGESIKDGSAAYKSAASDKHEDRWAYSHCPFFAAAYACDPEFVDHQQSELQEVKEGLDATVEKIGILLKVRILATKDDKGFAAKWAARRQAISSDPAAQKKWDDFPSYPTAKDKDVGAYCSQVISQLSIYRQKKASFAREWVMNAAKEMPAHLWWDEHGGCVPELQSFARLVLAQPASASICERINSEFEFIKDRRRNRLGHEKANKLVALFHNLRLLKRIREPRYHESSIAWSEHVEQSAVVKYQPGGATSSRSSLLQAV